MIAGAALAAWLADGEAQERSFQAVNACAHKWAHHPLLLELEGAVKALEPKTPEGLLAITRHYLDRTADIDEMIGDMIAAAKADPFFRPPFYALTNELMHGLLFYHHPDLSIALGVTGVDELAAKKSVKRPSGSINFTGYVTLMRFVSGGDAVLSLWEAPRIGDAFVAAEAGSCRMVGRRRIADGDELVFDGRYQSFTIEHAARDMVYFQATSRAQAAPVSVEYDSESKRPVGASSTDEASSRLGMMVSLLRAMECREAFPLIEQSLSSPQFYTRWHLMREMLALDAEAALPSLKRMAQADPHPDIRVAAQQALELFFPEETGVAAGGVECRA